MNDDSSIDLENPQMLQCVVFKSKKTSSNQYFGLKFGFEEMFDQV